jgi:hypothetical protein
VNRRRRRTHAFVRERELYLQVCSLKEAMQSEFSQSWRAVAAGAGRLRSVGRLSRFVERFVMQFQEVMRHESEA